MVELRRYERTPIDVDVEFSPRGATARSRGRAKDISLGGMFVETAASAPFGTEVVVLLLPPGQKVTIAIPAVVRWSGAKGMGLQFGLLGARETHAITELARARTRAASKPSF